jgi:hypothetical protein
LIRYLAGDPAFLADPVMQAYAETYTTVFFHPIAWLSHWVSIPTLFFLVFVACQLGIVWLAYRLGMALWNDRTTGLACAAILAISTRVFALDIVSFHALDHRSLTQVMILGSLVLAARGRLIASLAMIGLTFNVHALHAIHALGILVAASLIGRERPSAATLSKGIGAALICMSPTVVWMLLKTAPLGEVDVDYARIIYSWGPLHFLPTSWGPGDWMMLLFPILAAWPVWKLVQPIRDGGLVARFALLALVAGVVGGVLTELLSAPLLFRAHPMRASWLMGVAGLPLLARVMVVLLRPRAEADDRVRRVGRSLGVFLVAAMAMPAGLGYVVWLALAPALTAFVLARDGRLSMRTAGWIGVSGAAAISLTAIGVTDVFTTAYASALDAKALKGLDLILVLTSGLMLLCVLVLARAWLGAESPPGRGQMRAFRWLLAGFVGLFLALGMGLRILDQVNGEPYQWYDIQRWMAANLPVSDKVIVPLSKPGIRAFSNQIPVFDLQEGNLILHNASYAKTFADKAAAFGWTGERIYGLLGANWRAFRFEEGLTAEHVRRLGAEYGASVAVRSVQNRPWPLPELYRNELFVVYDLAAGGGSADSG